ncbi:MAG: hypothetical protein G01um101430_738, partial [Parcubacteria group bacterium Gr01-1014_30]
KPSVTKFLRSKNEGGDEALASATFNIFLHGGTGEFPRPPSELGSHYHDDFFTPGIRP